MTNKFNESFNFVFYWITISYMILIGSVFFDLFITDQLNFYSGDAEFLSIASLISNVFFTILMYVSGIMTFIFIIYAFASEKGFLRDFITFK